MESAYPTVIGTKLSIYCGFMYRRIRKCGLSPFQPSSLSPATLCFWLPPSNTNSDDCEWRASLEVSPICGQGCVAEFGIQSRHKQTLRSKATATVTIAWYARCEDRSRKRLGFMDGGTLGQIGRPFIPE